MDNEASQRVLMKNGSVQYGRAPEYLRIAGPWQEHLHFQVVLDDGRQLASSPRAIKR